MFARYRGWRCLRTGDQVIVLCGPARHGTTKLNPRRFPPALRQLWETIEARPSAGKGVAL
jgi:hypothetical protein